MKTKRVIVVGSGIAGLTAATHLARQGMHVTVVEKNDHCGGRCDQISQDGHHFDSGPTLLVMPLVYEAEFTALGAHLQDVLELKRVDPNYRLVFDDGSQLALTSEMNSLQEQLELFEQGSFCGLQRYLKEGERHYRVGMEKFVAPDFRRATDFYKLSNFPLVFQTKPLVNHYRNMAKYFKNPRLKAAFTFQDMYMGLSPFDAPATLSLMPYSELTHGVWYPRGGMFNIALALEKLAIEAGVEFLFTAPVERIDIMDGSARGVQVDGRHIQADAVVANADLPYVYQNLLPYENQVEVLRHKHYSCSVISFLWGVDKTYSSLGAHTLFLADDYRENFTSIIRYLDLPTNPSMYIHAPARLDPSMAPQDQDTLIAVVPVGHMDTDETQDWPEIRDEARRHVFRRLAMIGIMDLESHIKFEINITPPAWKKRYNLVKGSTHGLSHNLMQLGYFRPDLQHRHYRNLFFTGASTRPGTGIPTAMVSGRMAAKRIMDFLDGRWK